MPFIFIIRLRRIALIFIEVYRATVSLLEACVIKVECRTFVGAAESTLEYAHAGVYTHVYTYIYTCMRIHIHKREKRDTHF